MSARHPQSKKNARTAIILASVAAAFFIGFLLRRQLFG
jgi:hypothetical protein